MYDMTTIAAVLMILALAISKFSRTGRGGG